MGYNAGEKARRPISALSMFAMGLLNEQPRDYLVRFSKG